MILRYFLSADNGIDNVIPAAEQPEAEAQAEVSAESTPKEEKAELPAWHSQLSKEMRSNEELVGRISGYKTIGDLVNAYIKSEDDGKDAIHIPTKDSSPEDVKAFFSRLGVPDSPTDYRLSDYDIDPEAIKRSKELFMQAAHKSALTRKQAENMWMSEVAMYKAAGQLRGEADKKIKDAFEPSYEKLLEAEYPEETARKRAIKEEIGIITKWTQEQGIGKALTESGLVYNAEVMHKLASYIRSNSPDGLVQGKKEPDTQRAKGGFFDNYSEQFLAEVGR